MSPFQAILDYEINNGIPPGWVNYCISRTAPTGTWHAGERGEILPGPEYFAGFKRDLSSETLWREYNKKVAPEATIIPPVPDIDAEWLFWEMMGRARFPDPYMFPALQRLKKSGKFLLGALSNTHKFPDGHPWNSRHDPVREQFEVFVSSAHVGLRKPEQEIYELAISKLDALAKKKGDQEGIKAEDIVFIDDIGENLKAGKKAGMRTIKVWLGKTDNAVRALEEVTGLSLLEQGPTGPKL